MTHRRGRWSRSCCASSACWPAVLRVQQGLRANGGLDDGVAAPRRPRSTGPGSTFQQAYDEDGDPGVQGRAARGHRDLRRRRLGQGPDRPAGRSRRTGPVPTARSSPRTSEVQGPVPLLPDGRGADHGLVQPRRRREARSSRPTRSRRSSRARSRRGMTPRSRPTTPARTCRRHRSSSCTAADGSGTTANFTKFLDEAAAATWTLGTDKIVNWPADSRPGNGNAGVARDRQEHRRRDRLRRLLRRQGVGAGVRVDQERRPASTSSRRSTAPPRRWRGATVNADLTYDPLTRRVPTRTRSPRRPRSSCTRPDGHDKGSGAQGAS